MHWPAELTEPCSWYCHRETTGGCQHEPADVLHGTGVGKAAAAAAADRIDDCADTAPAGAAATADTTSMIPATDPRVRACRGTGTSSAQHPHPETLMAGRASQT